MSSWNDTPKRKHSPTEWFVVILAAILLIALMFFLEKHAKADDTLPPMPEPTWMWDPTPTATVMPPYHGNVYLPLIIGGE